MALKAILTAEEHKGVSEIIRNEYTEKDGKFFLAVDPVEGYTLENVDGLKTSLGKERTQVATLQTNLAKFKDLDPDAARQAMIELEELRAIDPKKEADKIVATKFETAKTQLVAKHNQDLAARDERIKKLSGTIENLLVDSVASTVIAEAKGSIELLLPHVRRSTRVTEKDGAFQVEVIDKEGNTRIGDSKGTPMSIKDLIADMRNSETFGRAFEGDGTTGSGKRPGTSGGGTPTGGLKRSTMTPEQKREYQQKHGQTAFLKLPLK